MNELRRNFAHYYVSSTRQTASVSAGSSKELLPLKVHVGREII